MSGTLVTRRARKQHTCMSCSGAIEAGDFYTEEQIGIAVSNRHCRQCMPANPLSRAFSYACPWCGDRNVEVSDPITTDDRICVQMTCPACTRRSTVETGDSRLFVAQQFKNLLADLD